MPVYHAFGDELLSRHDYLARACDFSSAVSFDPGPVAAGEAVRPFADIEFGKPLSVLIRRVYTGKFPERKRLSGARKPMLITSAIKDITTTSAVAQAVNLLKQSVSPRSAFTGPSALEEGTALVYYTPAVASSFITISLQVIFDDFNPELFQRAAQLFSGLAGVPIFMPAAGYLLGAASMLKLASGAGEALSRSQPALSESIELDFSFGGGSVPMPGYWVLSSEPLDLAEYRFDPRLGLLHRQSGRAYSGDAPVVVLSLDGSLQPALSNFAPLMASASLLGHFVSQKQGSEVMMEHLLAATKLYNDFTYRRKAEEIQQQLLSLREENPARLKLREQLDALNAGIAETRLKLALQS